MAYLKPDEGAMLNESPTDRALRLQLEDQVYEAEKMKEWFEAKIKALQADGTDIPFEYIEQYGHFYARLTLARDKQERMGWGK